jgi:hypothetical protein
MQPDKNKLFLLGLGAQKAGTTWLYSYLASASNVATDGVKEYHVWDVHHLPDSANGRVSREDSTQNLARRIQYALQQDPSGYFRYFDTFLEKSGRQVSCDITPSYAGLGSAALASVREGFAQRGIATRAIFLMRDPVERCWSAARMQGRLRAGDEAVTDEQVLAHVALPGAQLRTRYDVTIGEMDKAFAPEDRYVGLYEDMFRPENIARLSAFCRVSARPELAEDKVMVTPVKRSLSEDTLSRIARQFRPVYDFAASRYPQARDLWLGYRYL